MKSKNWLYGTLTVLPLLLTGYVYTKLPEMIPAHYDADMHVTRYGSRNEVFILPVMIFLIGFIFFFVARYIEKHADNPKNAAFVCLLGYMLLISLNVLNMYILYAACQ